MNPRGFHLPVFKTGALGRYASPPPDNLPEECAFETLRAEQNTLSKSVGAAKGDEKAALLENSKELANRVKAADAKRADIEAQANAIAMQLSNLLDPDAPIGGEADFVVIEHVGTPRDFAKDGFEPKDHVELGKLLGAIDTERGAKVAGSRSYYLTGAGALLEFALVNYAISSPFAAPTDLERVFCSARRVSNSVIAVRRVSSSASN